MSTKNQTDYQNECVHYLGHWGAVLFFTYAALRNDLSHPKMLIWTEFLQSACFKQPEEFRPPNNDHKRRVSIPKIDKPQISNWRRSNPLTIAPFLEIEGLDIRLTVVEIHGIGEKDWKGILLMICETSTAHISHHFLTLTKSSLPSPNWVLYVLSHSVEQISKITVNPPFSHTNKSLSIACFSENDVLQSSLANLADVLRKQNQIDNNYQIKWLKKDAVPTNFYEWTIQYIKTQTGEGMPTANGKLNVDICSSLLFSNGLARIVKIWGKSKSSTQTWFSLNRVKSNERKPVDRFDKKPAKNQV